MDGPTLTLLMGIISCVIGVSTFVSGRMAKAERNGSMETKIDQALDGIEDLKKKLEASANNQHAMDLMVRSHDEQIKTLFRSHTEMRAMVSENNRTHEALTELLQYVRNTHNP